MATAPSLLIDTKSLLDLVKTPVFVLNVDGDGQPVYAAFNKAAQDGSGYTECYVLGKTAKEIYAGQLGELAYNHHLEAVQNAKTTIYELALPLADSVARIRTTLEPIMDESGKVICLVGTSLNISAEHQAREAKVNTQTSINEIEQFVSLAAHDLRSPLRQVNNVASMLRAELGDMDEGTQELIELLERVSNKANKLVTEVLTQAQVTNFESSVVDFELSSLCDNIVGALDPEGRHQINIDRGMISADKTAVQIVLQNLIDNSIKHAGRDVIQINVTAEDVGTGMFEITMRDNGDGFRNPSIVFLNDGKLRPGSGYGLFGIRRLVSARGGAIWAEEPEEGTGAIIKFSLPGRFQTQTGKAG